MELSTVRHSLSHIMAQAIKNLYGNDVKMAIGPDTDTGFYYDFDFGWIEFKEEDLKNLEKKMKQIIKQNQKFEYYELPFEEAKAYLSTQWEVYKIEMAEDLFTKWFQTISFYKNSMQNGSSSFIDMCAGPHVENTNKIDVNAFCLEKIAGAYWRGDSTKKMLTRIYGLAFANQEELNKYTKMIEEAKKRDHRILWAKLKLFTFSDLVGPGLPLFTPEWTFMRNAIENVIMEIQSKYWFEKVHIPHITKKELYETSWHWKKYKDDLFHVHGKSDTEFVMKPMNCPHHAQIYASNSWSYRDLPVRYAETTTCYRDEQQWELLWLSRVRALTQDDGHIFCRVDQIWQEASNLVQVIKEFYTILWMFEPGKFWVSLSVRDPNNLSKYLWLDENWIKAENFLEEVAKNEHLPYKKVEWEAAFYWPKLDFQFKDAIGREWQLATIQIDFVQPENFQLEFTNSLWEKERPVMIHRAIAWSLERFMSVIIEHFAWNFPLWMSPRQVMIIPVWEKFEEYAYEVNTIFKNNNLKTHVDTSSDSFNKKIRNAEMMKNNYVVIVWEQEVENHSVSVRNVKTKEQYTLWVNELMLKLMSEIKEKSL